MSEFHNDQLQELSEMVTDLLELYSQPWQAEIDDPDFDPVEIVEIERGSNYGGKIVIASTEQTGGDEEPDMRLGEYLAALSPVKVQAILDEIHKLQSQVSDLFDAGVEAKAKNIHLREGMRRLSVLSEELSDYDSSSMAWHAGDRMRVILKDYV